MSSEYAARVGDGISHTSHENAGWMGMAAGAALGVIIIIATGGSAGIIAGIVYVAGFASTGADVGEAASGLLGGGSLVVAGRIVQGADTVHTGRGAPRAAKAHPDTKVSCHAGEFVAQGSRTTFIENHNASRRKDKTTCGGGIVQGCPTVLIGGAPAYLPGVSVNGEKTVTSGVYKWTRVGVDVASLGVPKPGLRSPAFYVWLADAYGKVGSAVDAPGASQVKTGVDLLKGAQGGLPKVTPSIEGRKALDVYREKLGAALEAGKIVS